MADNEQKANGAIADGVALGMDAAPSARVDTLVAADGNQLDALGAESKTIADLLSSLDDKTADRSEILPLLKKIERNTAKVEPAGKSVAKGSQAATVVTKSVVGAVTGKAEQKNRLLAPASQPPHAYPAVTIGTAATPPGGGTSHSVSVASGKERQATGQAHSSAVTPFFTATNILSSRRRQDSASAPTKQQVSVASPIIRHAPTPVTDPTIGTATPATSSRARTPVAISPHASTTGTATTSLHTKKTDSAVTKAISSIALSTKEIAKGNEATGARPAKVGKKELKATGIASARDASGKFSGSGKDQPPNPSQTPPPGQKDTIGKIIKDAVSGNKGTLADTAGRMTMGPFWDIGKEVVGAVSDLRDFKVDEKSTIGRTIAWGKDKVGMGGKPTVTDSATAPATATTPATATAPATATTPATATAPAHTQSNTMEQRVVGKVVDKQAIAHGKVLTKHDKEQLKHDKLQAKDDKAQVKHDKLEVKHDKAQAKIDKDELKSEGKASGSHHAAAGIAAAAGGAALFGGNGGPGGHGGDGSNGTITTLLEQAALNKAVPFLAKIPGVGALLKFAGKSSILTTLLPSLGKLAAPLAEVGTTAATTAATAAGEGAIVAGGGAAATGGGAAATGIGGAAIATTLAAVTAAAVGAQQAYEAVTTGRSEANDIAQSIGLVKSKEDIASGKDTRSNLNPLKWLGMGLDKTMETAAEISTGTFFKSASKDENEQNAEKSALLAQESSQQTTQAAQAGTLLAAQGAQQSAHDVVAQDLLAMQQSDQSAQSAKKDEQLTAEKDQQDGFFTSLSSFFDSLFKGISDVFASAKDKVASFIAAPGKAIAAVKDRVVNTVSSAGDAYTQSRAKGGGVLESAGAAIKGAYQGATGTTKSRETALEQEAVASGITDPKELSNFMGQMNHESAGFTAMKEGNYKPGSVWKMRGATLGKMGVTKEQVDAAYESGGSGAMDEFMYADKYRTGKNKMGNTDPGDASKYKGRGFTQLTGKNNYADMTKQLQAEGMNVDLVAHPELAEDPKIAAKIATKFWKKSGAGDAAREGDTVTARQRINGGQIGAADVNKKTDQYEAKYANGVPSADGKKKEEPAVAVKGETPATSPASPKDATAIPGADVAKVSAVAPGGSTTTTAAKTTTDTKTIPPNVVVQVDTKAPEAAASSAPTPTSSPVPATATATAVTMPGATKAQGTVAANPYAMAQTPTVPAISAKQAPLPVPQVAQAPPPPPVEVPGLERMAKAQEQQQAQNKTTVADSGKGGGIPNIKTDFDDTMLVLMSYDRV